MNIPKYHCVNFVLQIYSFRVKRYQKKQADKKYYSELIITYVF